MVKLTNAGALGNTKYLLLLSLPGPLWSGEEAPDSVLSMGQIELNRNNAKLNCLKLTVFTFNCVFRLSNYAKLNCLK